MQWSLATPNWPAGPDPAMRTVSSQDAVWYAEQRLPILAYSSTATGYFAGRPGSDKTFGHGDNPARQARAEQLADRLGCTPTQVALAWLRHQPAQVVPLTGTGSQAHLDEAVGSCRVSLTAEQVAWLASG